MFSDKKCEAQIFKQKRNGEKKFKQIKVHEIFREKLQNKNKIMVGIWIPDTQITETFKIYTCLCLDFEWPKMDKLIH